ncbi:MAG: TraB/GumN family protein [Alphaproteobacteria bacterium]|nr:TraB/GumN family protein [Alphaproteobacteria bacterium]
MSVFLVAGLLVVGGAWNVSLAQSDFDAADFPAPRPAIWLIEDEDSKIWLFGTIHLLPPDVPWRSELVDAAFAASGTVYFETPDPSREMIQNFIREHGANPPSVRLTSLLSEDGRASLGRVAEMFEIAVEDMQRMRPWVAWILLNSLYLQNLDIDLAPGADRVLEQEAISNSKDVKYLESAVQQFETMAGMSAAAEIALLEDTLRDIEDEPDEYVEIFSDWLAGDLGAAQSRLQADFSSLPEEVRERLLLRRNRAWVAQIGKILAGSGTVFIAVGAAHLEGAESVIELLAAGGIEALRQVAGRAR